MQRRDFLKRAGLATIGATPLLSGAAPSHAQQNSKGLRQAELRGALDANEFGVRPDSSDDQSQQLQRVLDKASEANKPVYIPPGTYFIANINLPARTRLFGLAGTARLVYAGGGAMLSATGSELMLLDGLVLDGANRPIDEEYGGLLYARACPDVRITNCDVLGSMSAGISLDTCGGQVRGNRISGAGGLSGLFSVNATGMAISDNAVEDCENGGILVHRWSAGDDNTIISQNRVARIRARDGGTGQRGNGINLFRANGVIVTGNHISDCAFSAIRANSASNASISGNTALNSGETAIYSEFAFEGSLITNNIVDGATMGVSISNFNEGGRLAVCANNLIRNLKTEAPYPQEVQEFGIGIGVEADTSVTGNVIEGAPVCGLSLGWGAYLRNVLASDNIIRDSRIGIAVSVVEGAQKAIIANNLISGARDGAIIGHDHTRAITGELENGSDEFPHLTLAGNVVV